MARKFFYVAMGVLALAFALHLGATRTPAQSDGRASFALEWDSKTGVFLAISPRGEVYHIEDGGSRALYMGTLQTKFPNIKGGSSSWGEPRGNQ